MVEGVTEEGLKMKEYMVYTIGGSFKVKASNISYDDNIISFYLDKKLVAILPIKGTYIVIEYESES